jgi:large subunit ribosomal protein L21
MYAIVRTGGKQYRVEEGRTVIVERLPADEGAAVELGDVLLIADDGQVTVGTPTIEGARVLAQVEAHGRDKKIIVFKYKAKVRTRKKTGHRQHFTRLAVTEILRPGQEPKKAAKPKRRRRRKKEEAPAEPPAVEAAIEAPAADAPAEVPVPKRRTRRKEPEAEPGTAEAPAETPTAEAPAPKRRTRRKPAEEGAADTPEASGAEEKPATTRRRSTRRKTEEKETE